MTTTPTIETDPAMGIRVPQSIEVDVVVYSVFEYGVSRKILTDLLVANP